MGSKSTTEENSIKLDINQLHNEQYWDYRRGERIFPSTRNALIDFKGNTKKYTFAQETIHKKNAAEGIFKCEATLVIEYKTDAEATKIARAMKKLAETAGVKLNVTFKKI